MPDKSHEDFHTWAMAVDKVTIRDLTPDQRKVIARILQEVPVRQRNRFRSRHVQRASS